MKYCEKCGEQLVDEAVVCTKCGCAVKAVTVRNASSGLSIAAKIFMIIGCIVTAFFGLLIPLCWTIPMTVNYFNATKNNKPIGVGFKVCSLLFVNVIAGILMLCDNAQ